MLSGSQRDGKSGTLDIFAIISKYVESDWVVVQVGRKKLKHGFWNYQFSVRRSL